jgi:hypothetical protein
MKKSISLTTAALISLTLSSAASCVAAQELVPLTTQALEGFWVDCESKCEGDFLCLVREKGGLEYFNSQGKVSYVDLINSDGLGSVGLIKNDVRTYSISDNVVSYDKLADEEEGWTWEISEFYGDRTVHLAENEITERCKVDNLDSVSKNLLMYMIALGELEGSPKRLEIGSTISQPQTSLPMLHITARIDNEFSSFLLGRDVPANLEFVLISLVFAGSQIPSFSSGVDGDSSGYAQNIGSEAVIFVSPEVREIERRRLFSLFRR